MNKKHAWGAVALVATAGAFFYGGMTYGQHAAQSTRGASFGNGQYQGQGTRTGMMRAGNGAATGRIIAKDASSLTIQMQNGSTRIILIGSDTAVTRSAAGTLDDLSVGKDVVITGASNPDGSMTAAAAQIRPQGEAAIPPASAQAPAPGY